MGKLQLLNISWRLYIFCILTAGFKPTQSQLEDKEEFFEEQVGGEASGSGELTINATDLTLPVCLDDELLSFDGGRLLCNKIPERKCTCPGPFIGSGEPPTLPPEPPGGCTIFQPPDGGAFTCLSGPAVIYCSVYCDNGHEFSTTPFNPYFCGEETKFEWRDFTGVTHTELPECTGFRYSLRPLHPAQFYLPVPCEALIEDQADVDNIRNSFCGLVSFFTRENCSISSVFVHCPRVTVTTTIPAHNPALNP